MINQLTQVEQAKRDSLDNSLTTNKFCFCRDFLATAGQCLICRELAKGNDLRTINGQAAAKYRVAITGTNGKTTLTNILGQTLARQYGRSIGFASTTGIYEGTERIFNNEHRASEHYTYLLNKPGLEIVISEQPEAGIYKYGLPIDHQIGIVTNLTSDHLDRYWIKNGMWDVYQIKSQVVRQATEAVITSIDYPWTERLVSEFNHQVFYLYSSHRKKAEKYILQGYPVCYSDRGKITIATGQERIDCGSLTDYLLYGQGAITYNEPNLLAIISFLYNSQLTHADFFELLSILKSIPPSFAIAPARFNIMRHGQQLIVIDYAHNADGYEQSMTSLLKLKKLTRRQSVGLLISVLSGKTAEDLQRVTQAVASIQGATSLRVAQDHPDLGNLQQLLIAEGITVDRWTDSFSDYLTHALAAGHDLIYITIAGLGKIKDMEQLVTQFKLTDLASTSWEG